MDPSWDILRLFINPLVSQSPLLEGNKLEIYRMYTPRSYVLNIKKYTPISSIVESPWITKDLLQGGWDQTQVAAKRR